MRIVTVDIDSQSIRLLQVDDNRVERWATAPLAQGVAEDGAIVDPQALAAQIRRLRRSSGISGGQIVAGMNGLFSVARLMTFPPGTQSQILERARAAIPGENLRLLWQTVRMNGAGQAFLVIGANEERVDSHIGVLRAAGLPPKVLELKSAALARTVRAKQALVVSVEPCCTDIVLIVDELPQVMRTIAVVGSPSVEERASQLARTLNHTVDYYNTSHEEEVSPSELPLILVGPLGDDPSLREQIEERVDFPLEPFTPELECPPHLPAAQFAVNVGLALRHATGTRENNSEEGPEPIRINLAPQRVLPWRISRQRVSYLLFLVVGFFIAYLMLQMVTLARDDTASLRTAVASISQQVNLRKVDLNRLTELEQSIEDFGRITQPWGNVTEARKLIDEVVTPGIQVPTFTVKGTQVEFRAKADSVAAAIQFVQALRADGRFGDIPFPRPTTDLTITLDLTASKGK